MRRFDVVVAGLLALLISACTSQQPQPQSQTAQPQPEFRTTATIKDIMDSMVDPGADYIWESVQTIVSEKGVENKAPKTDEEWKEVRRRAIMLLEATNLLQIPGRHVAKPGEKADDPKVELAPEQIEELINKDRASFNKFAGGLHEATMMSLSAIDEKNPDKLLDVGNAIDEACEKCHLQYWYPNEAKALAAQEGKQAAPEAKK